MDRGNNRVGSQILSHVPGRYRVQCIVHSATENSAGKSSPATGTGCGCYVWLAWPLCSPRHGDTVHRAGCIVSLSYCHLIALLCCSSHQMFFLPEMPYLYKTLLPLQSQCTWKEGGEASRARFPCKGRVCDPSWP